MPKFFGLFVIFAVGALCVQSVASVDASDAAAITLLQQSTTLIAGSVRLDDIQLTGTASWHAGSENIDGSVTMEATSSGRSRLQLDLGQRSRTETYSGHNEPPACTWEGPDKVARDMGMHNCWTVGPWFFPTLSLLSGHLQAKNLVSYAGQEVRGGVSVEHIQIRRAFTGQSKAVLDLVSRLSTVDLYLDSATKLPVSLSYSIHPEKDDLRDIPVEVRFSDYRDVGGVKVPFHIEKLLNGATTLEFSITSAKFNTGILIN